MTTQITIKDTNKMLMIGTDLMVNNVNIDQFITKMIEAFIPEADFDIIKQLFEWAKYPDFKLIPVSYIMQIEKDFLTEEMKQKCLGFNVCVELKYKEYQKSLTQLNGSILLPIDYKQSGSSRFPIQGDHIDTMCSYNELIHLCQANQSKNFGIGCMVISQYLGKAYASKLEMASKYIQYACMFISIWETNKKDQLQVLLSDNAKMAKQIETLTSQLSEMRSQFMPELVKYDYNEIRARLDPIRRELKLVQRLFARIIRSQYEHQYEVQLPMAVLVDAKSCE